MVLGMVIEDVTAVHPLVHGVAVLTMVVAELVVNHPLGWALPSAELNERAWK